MKDFVLAYDIFNPKRLREVRKIAYTHRISGQKSALETPFNKKILTKIIKKLSLVIEDRDKINIISVNSNPILLGKANCLEFEESGIIIL